MLAIQAGLASSGFRRRTVRIRFKRVRSGVTAPLAALIDSANASMPADSRYRRTGEPKRKALAEGMRFELTVRVDPVQRFSNTLLRTQKTAILCTVKALQ